MSEHLSTVEPLRDGAAAAKDLRLFLAALGEADSARPDEALENWLAELSKPV